MKSGCVETPELVNGVTIFFVASQTVCSLTVKFSLTRNCCRIIYSTRRQLSCFKIVAPLNSVTILLEWILLERNQDGRATVLLVFRETYHVALHRAVCFYGCFPLYHRATINQVSKISLTYFSWYIIFIYDRLFIH